jgi:hypothetical protein
MLHLLKLKPAKRTKGMTGFFNVEEKEKKPSSNKLETILKKISDLEKEDNHSELQKYFSFNIL